LHDLKKAVATRLFFVRESPVLALTKLFLYREIKRLTTFQGP
jgi:hypothetical protein